MRKLLLTALCATLTATGVLAETFLVAVPDALPKGSETVQSALWTLITRDLEPGDRLRVLNASDPGLVAAMAVPDDPRYGRAKWRVKRFPEEIAQIGAFLKGVATGPARADLTGTLRHEALARIDPEAPVHLLILGSVIETVPGAPEFSMATGEQRLVPSPGHLTRSVAETPWGMGTEGTAGLQNVSVHLCPIADDLSSDAEAAYQRFWGQYVALRGGQLVTWSADLPTCFERFTAGVTAPLEIAPYADDAGPLAMLEIGHGGVITEPSTRIVNGLPVAFLTLFSSQPHPRLPGVEVTTGVRYAPEAYPDRYENAWCYFNMWEDGVSVKFDLGSKGFGAPVVTGAATRTALRAGGISQAVFDAGKPACQWPTP